MNTLQTYISQLRQLLEPGRGPASSRVCCVRCPGLHGAGRATHGGPRLPRLDPRVDRGQHPRLLQRDHHRIELDKAYPLQPAKFMCADKGFGAISDAHSAI
jgi:hypothetical protein